MKEIYFFIDDSGSLHVNNPTPYFVYTGYVFIGKSEKDDAKRRYRGLNKKIKILTERNDELKACNLSVKHKRALFNVLKPFHSFHVCVEVKNVYEPQKSDKNTIVRYKDYVLKRLIKKVVKTLIYDGSINNNEPIKISIKIDQQLTCTNGFYGLKDSIYEELVNGIHNFDYGKIWRPILHGDLELSLQYCDSKNEYLIQASDILANRILSSYRDGNVKLRQIENHIALTLP